MNKKIPHLIVSLCIAVSIFILPQVALAQSGGGFICSPTGAGATVSSCVNRIYTIAIVAASIGAVFMIVLAGYMYMLSGGSEGRVSTAKSFIISSIAGLGILLAGLLILKQINPDLLKFKKIQPEGIAAREWVLPDGTVVSGSQQPAGSVPKDKGLDVKQCPEGIVAIPTSLAGQSGESACKTLLEALQQVKTQATTLGVNFIITDAFDATGKKHESLCHIKFGTCADLVPTNPSPDRWNKLCQAINATGRFRILNEYSLGGAPDCGPYKKTPKAKGNHLHIVLQGKLDDLTGQ